MCGGGTGWSVKYTYVDSVLHIGVHFFNAEGSILVEQGVECKISTYVDSVLHIGVHYIDF